MVEIKPIDLYGRKLGLNKLNSALCKATKRGQQLGREEQAK
jgi:hypothetical protein